MRTYIKINNIDVMISAIEGVSQEPIIRPTGKTFQVEVFTCRRNFIEEFKDEASALVFRREILDSIHFSFNSAESNAKDFQSILNLMNTAITEGRSLNPTEMSLALIRYNDSDQII